ncbi:hypothetical protein L211DRAFT_865208, partial [Terfezia boudieri ATCC MYA-4762]
MSAMKSRWAEFSNVVFNGVTDFKLFLEWHLENTKIGALSTLETRWKYLRLYYTCEVGHAMDKNMSTEITAFLSQLAFKVDLQQDKKPKGVITHHDVGHLLRSHWEYEWRLKDGRRCVELALIVLLLSYMAGRPGAVLDTMCHPGEALKYKNFEIVAIRNGGGERLYTMKVSYHLLTFMSEENYVNRSAPSEPNFIVSKIKTL